MEKVFSNGRFVFPDDGSCYSTFKLIECGNRFAYVFGDIDCIVNYASLKYQKEKSVVELTAEKIIVSYLRDLTKFQDLAQLSGNFFLVIVKNDAIELLITSDSLDSASTIYYRTRAGRVSFSTDYLELADADYFCKPKNYNKDVLSLRPKGVGHTYLNSISRLGSRAVYSVVDTNVSREAAVFWGKSYHRQLTENDLFNVIGQKLEGNDHALAYSTGIDSHHILSHQKDKISEVCTYYYEAPYLGQEKTKAVGMAHINSIIENKPFNSIAVDLNDKTMLKYLQHSAVFQIFSPHTSVVYYKLFEQACSNKIITGEAGDAAPFCFDNTSCIDILDAYKRKSLLYYRLKRSYYQKKRTKLSELVTTNENLLLNYNNDGLLKTGCSFDEVSETWPLEYYARCNQGLNSGVASLYSAAHFHNKKLYLPAAEPLVLYVAGQAKRGLNILDPKANLRKRYSYFRDTDIERKIPLTASSQRKDELYDEIEKKAKKIVPDMYKMIKSLCMPYKLEVHIMLLSSFWKENG